MSNNREDNEFLLVKNNREHLESFSKIVQRDCDVHSINDNFVSFEDEQKAKREQEAKLAEIKKKETEELQKREAQFASLDFSFLANETRFKVGWIRLEKKLKDSGKEFDNETFLQLSYNNQVSIVEFCKKMFERKDSKWGNKNNDYAKEYAEKEVKRVLVRNIHEL
jgi:hypothetical protein